MIGTRIRKYWHTFSLETRIGIGSGIVLTVFIGLIATFHTVTSLDTSILQSGLRAAVLLSEPEPQLETRRFLYQGLTFLLPLLLPGFIVGTLLPIIYRYARNNSNTSPQRWKIIIVCAIVPVATIFVFVTLLLLIIYVILVAGTALTSGRIVAAVLGGAIILIPLVMLELIFALIVGSLILVIEGVSLSVGFAIGELMLRISALVNR